MVNAMEIDITEIEMSDCRLPFSNDFQIDFAKQLEKFVAASPSFTEKFGPGWSLSLCFSGKSSIRDTEIAGPGIYRKGKAVEFSIFIPYDVVSKARDAPRSTLEFLFQGIYSILQRIDLETQKLRAQEDKIIARVLSNPKLLDTADDPFDFDFDVSEIDVNKTSKLVGVSDHDPFNEPETAHPRARQLMTEKFFWDCVDEEAPFGSDEAADAYAEFRKWRSTNKKKSLKACLSWIMQGKLRGYTEKLCSDASIEEAVKGNDKAFLADDYDMFTLDATVIATGLGQLIDEGRIDADAKPYINVAIKRQLHPKVLTSKRRKKILLATQRVIDAA